MYNTEATNIQSTEKKERERKRDPLKNISLPVPTKKKMKEEK